MNDLKPSKGGASARGLLLILSGSIFLSEMLVMWLLRTLPPFSRWGEALLDSTLLSIPVFPIVYCFVFRPLRLQIIERQQAEAALRTSEERFKRLSASAPVGIFETDAQGAVLYQNDRWCEITGLARSDARGFGWSQALHPDDRDRVLAEWTQCQKEAKGYHGEFRFVRPGGEVRWVLTRTAPVFTAEGEVIGHVGANEDITERKKGDAQREFLIKSLEEALADLKTLSGLIPICAWCKKIRDDQGYWNQVEIYVERRSSAQFSHGLCPECLRRCVPDEAASRLTASSMSPNP